MRTIRVDKDVELIREHFQLHHIDYQDMSPLLITRGYTRDYVDGKISHESQMRAILDAVGNVREKNHVVVCEGAGSTGMGSIVGASNASVASLLGADMVLVANGGLGSTFDELELNRVFCESHNVNIAGVVINKVVSEKYNQTVDYMTRALEKRWNVPLLGCIPDNPYLGCPALVDMEMLFDTTVMTGSVHRFRHYEAKNTTLIGASLDTFLKNFKTRAARTLYLCHVTRDDIILAFLDEYLRWKNIRASSNIRTSENNIILEKSFEGALIICGRAGKYELPNKIKNMIMSTAQGHGDDDDDGGVPIMTCEFSTYKAIEMIHNCTPMLTSSNVERVNAAVEHYEHYIDFDVLLKRTGHVI